MPDNSPLRTDRKRLLIGPAIIVVAMGVLIIGAIMIRADRDRTRSAAAVPPPPPPPAAVNLAEPTPVLTRADLVQEARAAASAYAAGSKPVLNSSPMVGRKFIVRIAFGCGGPRVSNPTAQANVELDPATSTLKLSAQPANWSILPALQDLPSVEKTESIEGFWIPRPWVNSEACPEDRETPLPATPTPTAAQTVGLARIFKKGGSRVLMRGERPYQFARKLPKDGAEILSHTYRLVLEGRLVGFGDRRATQCWEESPDHRPICLYAVEYDRVAFEDANTGKTLADWRE